MKPSLLNSNDEFVAPEGGDFEPENVPQDKNLDDWIDAQIQKLKNAA